MLGRLCGANSMAYASDAGKSLRKLAGCFAGHVAWTTTSAVVEHSKPPKDEQQKPPVPVKVPGALCALWKLHC